MSLLFKILDTIKFYCQKVCDSFTLNPSLISRKRSVAEESKIELHGLVFKNTEQTSIPITMLSQFPEYFPAIPDINW